MEHFNYIFVILVYRNTGDLEECLESIKRRVSSYKIIVVNAYYDDNSQQTVKRIAEKNQCVFISIENKGYSFGNNCGIDYARNHFDYDFIIVSNPDVVIDRFDDSFIHSGFEYDIIAPQIIAASGKAQNPAMVIRLPLSEYMIYRGYKTDNRVALIIGLGLSKIVRELILFVKKVRKQSVYTIYCAHGSFLLLSKRIIECLYPVYDDHLFLFGEEGVLACKAKRARFKTCYSDFISIQHKEDGSMKLSDISINGEMRKSNLYYYEHYVLR